MIETHVMHSMVDPAFFTTPLFKVLNFINGLVAPAFLFASGLVYAVATRRKLPEYLAFRFPLFRQFGRLLLLFFFGYALHLPKFEYHHLRYDAGHQAWLNFFQVDVLQCIGMSLLILLIATLMLRSERRVYGFAGILLTIIAFATPVVWSIDLWTFLPVPIAEYGNGLHASLFPLFPWAAFVLGGVLTGGYYLLKRDSATSKGEDLRKPMFRLAQYAVAIIFVSFIIDPFAANMYPVYEYWKTSPSFFMLRLALVLLLCIGLFFYEQHRGVSASSMLALAGRESLLIYVAHLMILWGNYRGPHLVDRVGHSLTPLQGAGASLALIAAMLVFAFVWDRIKRLYHWVSRLVIGIGVAVTLYLFFVGM
jgi:hypothetical protein